MKQYLLQFLIAIDQLINTFFGGWADETLSSRAYRKSTSSKFWKCVRKTIDTLFFWDKEAVAHLAYPYKYHCQKAYESEKARRQWPMELRESAPKLFS